MFQRKATVQVLVILCLSLVILVISQAQMIRSCHTTRESAIASLLRTDQELSYWKNEALFNRQEADLYLQFLYEMGWKPGGYGSAPGAPVTNEEIAQYEASHE